MVKREFDMVKRYIKKPIEIEAIKYTGRNGWYINDWSKNMVIESPVLEPSIDNPTGQYLQIQNAPTMMPPINTIVNVGDYVVKTPRDYFYSRSGILFESQYDML